MGVVDVRFCKNSKSFKGPNLEFYGVSDKPG